MRRFPAIKHKELEVLAGLDTPSKVQDLLDSLRINFENNGETCRSPLSALRHNEAHCMEGAMLAAAALWYHGDKPLLMNLKTVKEDYGHVVALFRKNGLWGAISKTNHGVLRYRDPVYKTPRELALSYFNEYFLDSGVKTLRGYSLPYNLLRHGTRWLTAEEDLWDIDDALFRSPHVNILQGLPARSLRPADKVEIEAGKIVEWTG